MDWLSSWFTSGKPTKSRKGQALSSTHEAFSIPTTSPGLLAHPDAFNPEMLGSPDPDTSSSYTYPPQTASYTPYSPASSRPTSLLPLYHQKPLPSVVPSSNANYPPLAHTWNRIRTWLEREYPELGDTLNYGILSQDLAHIELQLGLLLPPAVRESYMVVNGQEAESSAGCPEGLFFGLTLLPLEDVLEEWKFWRDVDDDPTTGANPRLQKVMQSLPPHWIRREYSTRGWIPLIADKTGNYIGIDLNPDIAGFVGQVIVFGRDFDTKVVLWGGDGEAGWAKWLASFADKLESGEGFEIGTGNDCSEGSEDGLGYEGYFYDGTGRGQGDGGGDVGAGGLRFIGEYRGWSPLEAWADRSVRKWHDAGLLPDVALSSEEGKEQEEGTVDSVNVPAAESVAPLLMDGKASDSSVTLTSITGEAPPSSISLRSPKSSPRPAQVALSLPKPPAPLPVELPSPEEIEPFSGSSILLDEDLEAGHGIAMVEVSRDHQARHAYAAHQLGTKSISAIACSIPLPSSPPLRGLIDISPPSPSPAPRRPPDLLTDVASITTLESLTPILATVPPVSNIAAHLIGGEESEEELPQTSIRLVGTSISAGAPVESCVSELHDIAQPDDETEGAPHRPVRHNKRASLALGLKKLGNVAVGMRRKVSESSPSMEAA